MRAVFALLPLVVALAAAPGFAQTTAAGHRYSAPESFTLSSQGPLLRFSAPEGDSTVTVVDLAKAKDAADAVAQAWALAQPDFKRTLRLATPRAALFAHEAQLLRSAVARLAHIPGLRLVGTPRERLGVISFLLGDAHPHDVGTLLDRQGIAVRTGHHCTMPLMQRLGVPGTVRASFSAYNTEADVDRLIAGLEKTSTFL